VPTVFDRSSSTAAASCGLAAAAWAFLVPVIAAQAGSPYSHIAQYISELGASGAANACWVAAAGFAPTGAFVLAFLVFASGVFPVSRGKTAGVLCLGAVGLAYLAAALFPCDPGCPSSGSRAQSLHNFFGLLEYLGAFAGLLLLGAAFRKSALWRALSSACFVSAISVALGLGAMLVPGLEALRGISQRVAEAAIFVWVGYASVFLLRLRQPA
jgi:hypothetical protein